MDGESWVFLLPDSQLTERHSSLGHLRECRQGQSSAGQQPCCLCVLSALSHTPTLLVLPRGGHIQTHTDVWISSVTCASIQRATAELNTHTNTHTPTHQHTHQHTPTYTHKHTHHKNMQHKGGGPTCSCTGGSTARRASRTSSLGPPGAAASTWPWRQ